MRIFSSATLLALGGLFSLISATDPKVAASVKNAAAVEDTAVESDFTTFNGQKVPAIKDVGGKALEETLKEGYTVVKFFSPMCSHCKVIAPLWQTLYEYYWTSQPVPSKSSIAKESLNDFHHYYHFDFANVNCVAYGDSCEKYDVTAYPTLIIFKDGKEVDKIQGGKDMKIMGEFIEKTLETIRPGSRVKGGVEYPEVGAHSYEPKAMAAKASVVDKDVDPSTAAASDPSAVAASSVASETPKAAAAPKDKASGLSKPLIKKLTANPNVGGASVPLDQDRFDTLVTRTKEPWFIKFYAPWCGHCQALAPVWSEFGKEMQGKLNIGEVNCDTDSRLCKDLRINSYPTMMYFRGGERVEYDGLRGLGDLVSYAKQGIEQNDGVQEVDLARFEEMEEKNEVIFVYFYDMATTTEDFIALERLTLSLIGHAKIVKTQDPAMFDRFKITTWPRLIVSRDGRPTYYAPITPDEMRDYRQVLHWMRSVWLPIVPELVPSNARHIMDGKIVVLGILTRDRPDEFMIAKNEIKSAAGEWMDKQVHMFQIERQEFRDAKQLRIEEAEARDDQRAVRAAKSIRIDMNRSERKEVTFAWVDGVFWERWIRTTFGIQVADGERVIINDEDVSYHQLIRLSNWF